MNFERHREVARARALVQKGAYLEALEIYKRLKYTMKSKAFDYDIKKLTALIVSSKSLPFQLNSSSAYHSNTSQNQQKPDVIKEPNIVSFSLPGQLPLSLSHYSNHIDPGIDTLKPLSLSVVIPYFNQPEYLRVILQYLLVYKDEVGQLEVVISDDGSNTIPSSLLLLYERKFPMKYVRRPNTGYTLNAARNIGINIATNDYILLLDGDVVPSKSFFAVLSQRLLLGQKKILFGYRKYVSFSTSLWTEISNGSNWEINLRQIKSSNPHMPISSDGHSMDRRLDHFHSSSWLEDDPMPYLSAAGCAMAFPKLLWSDVKGFDEAFNEWGCDDLEFAYKAYMNGAQINADQNLFVYHLEEENSPPLRARNQENMIPLLLDRCPILRYCGPFMHYHDSPKSSNEFRNSVFKPLVSIIISSQVNSLDICKIVNQLRACDFNDWRLVVLELSPSNDRPVGYLWLARLNDPRVKLIHYDEHCSGEFVMNMLQSLDSYYVLSVLNDKIFQYFSLNQLITLANKRFLEGVEFAYIAHRRKNSLAKIRASVHLSRSEALDHFGPMAYLLCRRSLHEINFKKYLENSDDILYSLGEAAFSLLDSDIFCNE